jgi:hypothetical protein
MTIRDFAGWAQRAAPLQKPTEIRLVVYYISRVIDWDFIPAAKVG